MRKLYNEFFHVPKDGKGKIREKVMLIRTAVTVVIMLVCLAAMGLTAYAYFTYSVTSASNVIQAANFKTKVSIQISSSNNEPVTVEQLNAATQAATLHAGNEYSVTIEKTGTAQTGFCIISATGCAVEKYHTQQIGKDVKSNTEGENAITFKLVVTNTTVVSFLSHWGTSSYYADYGNKGENDALYIIDGETVTMQIDDTANSTGNTTEAVHTVEAGETLSQIAGKYHTTSKRIAVYNEISDPNSIQVGQSIRIPPAEWVLPETTTSQVTTSLATAAPSAATSSETGAPTGVTEPSFTESTAPTTSEHTESAAGTETAAEGTAGAPTTEANT